MFHCTTTLCLHYVQFIKSNGLLSNFVPQAQCTVSYGIFDVPTLLQVYSKLIFSHHYFREIKQARFQKTRKLYQKNVQ